MKRKLTADELIAEISQVLSEVDGEYLQVIANQLLTGKVTYKEDSVFEVQTVEDDEFQCVGCKEVLDIEDSIQVDGQLFCPNCVPLEKRNV